MTTVYNDNDFNKVIAQKKKIFYTFLGVTVGYAAFCVAWLLYYISLPYADPMQSLPKACVYVASALYVLFVFPFMGIKFHRIRRYYKMMYYLSEGLKNVEENYFVGFESKDLQKDYVDATACIFKTWNKKKSEWMEREAYFDNEKPLPDLKKGDLVKYILQSNFIVQYEIIERGALVEEKEEAEESEAVDEEISAAEEVAETEEASKAREADRAQESRDAHVKEDVSAAPERAEESARTKETQNPGDAK